MKDLIIILLVIPYLFLFTRVEEISDKVYKQCKLSQEVIIDPGFRLSTVYYSLGIFTDRSRRIILPRYEEEGKLTTIACEGAEKELAVGLDWTNNIGKDTVVSVTWTKSKVYLFGTELGEIEGVSSIGWTGGKK